MIAGVKPANLVSISKLSFPNAEEQVNRLISNCAGSGLTILTACECAERLLVYVFRADLLEKVLSDKENVQWLSRFGYESGDTLDEKVARMLKRLSKPCGEVFPHEVGVFLGYPLEDVQGFVRYGGREAKISGYWKVYGDEEKARRIFSEYEKCFAQSLVLAKKGASIVEACCLMSA